MKKILGLIITTIFLAGAYGLYKTNVENVSAASTNLIPNPSLETGTTTPTNWQKGGWGTSTKTYTYPVAGQEGTKAAKVKITGYSSGDAKWYFDDVTVKPSTQYTLSSYYIGTVASEIDLRYTLTTGAQTYVVLNKPAIASTWTKKEFTFTTPSNAKSLTVFHVIAKNGELTIDNFSLTETLLGTSVPTVTPTATPVVTSSPTSVATSTATPVVTASPVPSATPVVTPSPTPVATPTATPAVTATPTPTSTPSGNLILNYSVENGTTLPTNWAKGGWGTNTSVLSYPAEANEGTKGIKIVVSSFTNGDAKWFFDDVTVKPSTQYTFSDYYKSSVATELVIRYTSTTNAQTYVSIANPAIASSWTKVQVNFTTPNNVKSMTVFHLIAKVGDLTTDNYYLNETALATPTPSPTATPTVVPTATPVVTPSPTPLVTPSPTPVVTPTPSPVPTVTPIVAPTATPVVTPSPVATNLIANGSVENTTDNINPTSWGHGGWGTNIPVFTYPAEASDGSKGIKVELTSRTDGDAKWVFNEVSVTPNTVYTFSNSYKSNVQSTITVQFKHSNNTYTYSGLSDPVASANWADTSYNFTTPSDVTTVTIFHSIAAVGWLVTDNYKLVPFSVNQFSQGMVSFNFDDGYLSVYQNAIPMLNSANIKSTQYIISETLGGGFAEYVNASQVLAMQAQGHEIGAHSITHSDLTLASPSALINEVAGSKSALETAGVNTIKTFAYPYGNYNAAVIQAAKNAGYGSARGAYPDAENYKNTNKYELQMVDIQLATPLATVKSWVDQAIANKSWVILMFHQVDNLGDQYSTTPARMQEVINYVVSKGVMTVTNSEGVALMN